MYNITKGQITFENLEKFCNEGNEEGLILDYKIDWPNDLSRVLCGMANVQGGMVLVGVGTQTGTRLPAWPPPGVGGTDDQLNARVVQIAYDAIYPPVFPQIDVVRLPDNPARAIAVIRVDPSRLMHATDDRRRVCIRIFDHTRGVQNDLANLSQLEWLFQQRDENKGLRQGFINRAKARATTHFSTYLKPEAVGAQQPAFAIYSMPSFPQSRAVKSPAEVYQTVAAIGRIKADAPRSSLVIPRPGQWRTTADGAFSVPYAPESTPQYFEVGSQGLMYVEQILPVQISTDRDPTKPIRLVRGYSVLACCDAFVSFAAQYYRRLGWYGPVQLVAELSRVQNIFLDHRHPAHWSDPPYDVDPSRFTQDAEANLFDGEYQAQVLAEAKRSILIGVTQKLMWTFGFSDSEEQLATYVAGLLEWTN